MARKKDEGGGIPEWMCTFGDMMSLLLCFFIMLYSMSIIAPRRWQAIADTFKQEFGYQGSSNTKSKNTKTTTVVSESAAKSRRTAALTGGQPIAAPEGDSTQVLEILLSGNTVKGGVILFEPGNEDLTEQAEQSLRSVLTTLRGSPQKIMIKGRVSPSEGAGIYKQGSSLAYARAVKVLNKLVSWGLPKESFQIVAETGSVPNLTLLPPGTALNQAGASVEIILLDQTPRMMDDSIKERTTGTPIR